MSSPMLYKVIYIGTGLISAIMVPVGAGWLAYQHTENVALSVFLAVAVIYHLMAISVGVLSLYQYVPESHALGPSFMAGWGILTLGMTVVPILAVPGMVWLFILPFDEEGYLNWSALFQLDPNSFEEPHHN